MQEQQTLLAHLQDQINGLDMKIREAYRIIETLSEKIEKLEND
jgi:hypothetical protein